MNKIAKPYEKWAGGKGNVIRQLDDLLPEGFSRQHGITYIEPFVGGGAMLFHVLHKYKCVKRVIINDINSDLIHCYRMVANTPNLLIERLSDIERNFFSVSIAARKELYYAYREMYNLDGVHPDERAALLIFLNHTCYNGLYRVNANGKFNVPYGNYKNPKICDKDIIMADHKLLSSVELVIRHPGDYKGIYRNLSRKYINIIYFDPPYRPLSDTSYFTEYSNNPFGDAQQIELKKFCDKLSKASCQIMLSNSDSYMANGESFFENLYSGYSIVRVYAPRFINAKPLKRTKLSEVVIRNY